MLSFYLCEIEDKDNRSKFEQIYFRYKKEMYIIANKILRNREDTEDAVQDAFVLVMRNLDKIDDVDARTTANYIRTIVKNRARQIYNRCKQRESLTEDDDFFSFLPDRFQNVESQIERKELAEILEAMILKLPDKYREVLYLYYYNEKTYSEIASMLDTTEVNARQIARRARKLLEEKLLKTKLLSEELPQRRAQYE